MATDSADVDRAGHDLDSAYRAHRDWLVRRLALIVGDAEEAHDLAQEAFVRAMEHWPLPDMTEPARWLATVGVRLAIDERRRRRRWGFLPVRETDATWAMGVDPDLWRALARLDRRTRAAIVLTTLDGYTGRVPLTKAFAKSGGFPGDDPAAPSFRAFLADPILRLPVGTWHIYANASSCSPAPLKFELAAEIEVAVDPDHAPEPLPSGDASAVAITTAAKPNTSRLCMAAALERTLAVERRTGALSASAMIEEAFAVSRGRVAIPSRSP